MPRVQTRKRAPRRGASQGARHGEGGEVKVGGENANLGIESLEGVGGADGIGVNAEDNTDAFAGA
jgi:hypothetical protein